MQCNSPKHVVAFYVKIISIVDGNWALWYPWSACQGDCSNGTRSRFRNCDNPRQACGGNHCIGVYRQTDDTCLPIDCTTSKKSFLFSLLQQEVLRE
ncbi:ECT-like protein [Mya arenaria]|uniref:ECT-like protein n=1 Tax=Mya arenaria TaxID=6604 RepID=A0ABY7FWR4_MYAAR|nr:ECT-like protein [Mya arenaria]